MNYKLIKCISWNKRFVSSYINDRTICALSTAKGKGAVAVIKVSGKESRSVLRAVLAADEVPQARLAKLAALRDPQSGRLLDRGLAIWFPGPRSFTGEDCFELHVHGGRAVVASVLDALTNCPGVRLAEPGEFMRRAFLNDKMALSEIEGYADLIEAETEEQRKQAIEHSQGAMRKVYTKWRNSLLKCITDFEADINFGDTDQPKTNIAQSVDLINAMLIELHDYLRTSSKGIMVRDGIRVVIFGAPNVGKSSLINALCKTNRSIVDEIAGTTRDLIEVPLDIKGHAVHLFDTAGLRDATNNVEMQGIQMAKNALDSAHLRILLIDIGDYLNWHCKLQKHDFIEFIKQYIQDSNQLDLKFNQDATDIKQLFNEETIIVLNKSDLIKDGFELPKHIQCISSKYHTNIEELVDLIAEKLNLISDSESETPKIAHKRHCQHLETAAMHLNTFIELHQSGLNDMAILVNYLNLASRQLGLINGRIYTDEVLDNIFNKFCIGK